MKDQLEEPHILLGAYVLGGLSDEDRQAFSDHLRSCRECQDEYDLVAGIPRLLDLVEPADLKLPARSPSAGRPSGATTKGLTPGIFISSSPNGADNRQPPAIPLR